VPEANVPTDKGWQKKQSTDETSIQEFWQGSADGAYYANYADGGQSQKHSKEKAAESGCFLEFFGVIIPHKLFEFLPVSNITPQTPR